MIDGTPNYKKYAPRPVSLSPVRERPRTASRIGSPIQRSAALERVLAILCYSVPLVPGLWLLWRERDSRFLRFHAAQSLVFYGLIATGQIAIYLVLMAAGGTIHSTAAASVAAAIIVLLFAGLGLSALLVWVKLVWICVDGRVWRLPFVWAWAARLDRATSSIRSQQR